MPTGDFPEKFCRMCKSPISDKDYIFREQYYYHVNCYFWNVSYDGGPYIEPKIIIKEQSIRIRDSWEKYFIRQADSVSTRSTCDRKHCGAVIVNKNNRIRGTGYNGSNPGDPHCDDVGHFMVDSHCTRTIHAEINAIKDAKEVLSSLEDCKIFINTFPCIQCFVKIIEEGIKEVYYKDEYRTNQIVLDLAKLYNIKIEKVTLDV